MTADRKTSVTGITEQLLISENNLTFYSKMPKC